MKIWIVILSLGIAETITPSTPPGLRRRDSAPNRIEILGSSPTDPFSNIARIQSDPDLTSPEITSPQSGQRPPLSHRNSDAGNHLPTLMHMVSSVLGAGETEQQEEPVTASPARVRVRTNRYPCCIMTMTITALALVSSGMGWNLYQNFILTGMIGDLQQTTSQLVGTVEACAKLRNP